MPEAAKQPENAAKKEDRRVRRTKKLLVQALTDLLQEKQVKEITVRELTDLADMNRGTFYLYYKDIFDMLEKVEDEMFRSLGGILARHGENGSVLQVRPVLLDLFSFIGENQAMCRVLLSPHGDMNFLHRLNNVIRETCLKIWPQAQTPDGEAEFDYHYSFAVFSFAGLIRAWVSRGCPESPEQMAALADAMIFRGSLAEP